MNDYTSLLAFMQQQPAFAQWAGILPAQIENGLSRQRHGDLPAWQSIIESLPELVPSSVELDADRVRAGIADDVNDEQRQALRQQLKQLSPWRKGPYELFGIHIDTEWHSDWKWDRLKDHIQPLQGKTVLDVGCGNGYHCWRMKGAGAERVIGIDPTPLFIMQYQVLRKYLGEHQVDVVPVGIDDVPKQLQGFDTVFSMGVLYHRRSPIDHILQLKGCLKPGGELVLETLIIDAGENEVLVPEDRYARMGNVWFIPSIKQLERWLQRCGMKNIRLVDVNQTSVEEQRATEWMEFQSLKDFLDPADRNKSIEGYPAPKRAIILSHK
ncbi:MAG: tRNA 5-methoxyuridine(34)/uridine 5-oxyacetic acid(34) synthase CmoB [Thioalkalispiraceae bacterium]|jgi:tRNA (mo5U34)-methyltransferase